MPIINLEYDLNDVSSEFEPIPAGTYAARISDVELTESSTNKPMLKFKWEITEGEFAGRTIIDFVVLTVGWRVKQYAEVAGIESGTELVTEDFMNCDGVIEVTTEEYNGEMRNRIKKVMTA